MQLPNYWRGLRVLITGGSAGLGLQLATLAAAAGANVAVVARRGETLAAAFGAIPNVHRIEADVAAKDATYRIAGAAAAALGGIDVLINNASYLGVTPLRLLADTDCEDLERVLAANLIGPFRLIKALLPAMLLRRGGLVVNISSDAAVAAYPAWGAYAASKAALDQLSRVYDAELRASGVRVVAVDPGDMRTAMHHAAVPEDDPAQLADPAEVARALLGFLPLVGGLADVRFSAGAWRAALAAGSQEAL